MTVATGGYGDASPRLTHSPRTELRKSKFGPLKKKFRSSFKPAGGDKTKANLHLSTLDPPLRSSNFYSSSVTRESSASESG